MAFFFLSENDRNILQELINWWKDSRRSVKRGKTPHKFQSPDVYIALPPEDGIPALTLTGSSPAAGDTPGSATCDIYKIDGDGDLEAYTGLDKTVYNVSTSIVTQKWIVVERSKQGKWVIPLSGGGVQSYKVTTFPRWDATENELFIRAIPTPIDEDSESNILETTDVIDGVVSGDVVIFLTGIFLDEGRTTANVHSIRPGLRIWAISANSRLELVSFPTPETARYQFSKSASDNVPPYSILRRINGRTVVLGASDTGPTAIGEQLYDSSSTKALGNLSGVNGAWSVGTDSGTGGNEVAIRGSGSHGLSNYVFARVNQSVLGSDEGATGQMWGPTPLDSELYPGIPGFVLMMDETTPVALGDGGFIYGFLQVPGFQVAFAKTTEAWNNVSSPEVPYVRCNPVLIKTSTGPGGITYPYDGSTVGPAGNVMPSVEIVVFLPRNSTERDPNIQSGNYIWYRQSGPQRQDSPTLPFLSASAGGLPEYICAGDYLDDKIGTIKFWKLSSGSIPQGWQQLASSAGDFIRCANAFADVGTTFGTTGTDHTLIDMICIERFQ